MTPNPIEKQLQTAQESVSSFLKTLLSEAAPLETGTLQPIRREDAEAGLAGFLLVYCPLGPDQSFAVVLDPAWISALSEAMLGQPLQVGDEGAHDLARETVAQGFGAIRNQLAAEGLRLPDAPLEVASPGDLLRLSSFADELFRVEFGLPLGEQRLEGHVLLPAAIADQPAPQSAAQAPPQQAPQQAAPSVPRSAAPSVNVAPASFPDLGSESSGDGASGNFELLAEVELEVRVELGRRRIPLSNVLSLTTGSVIELEKLVGEPLEVYANGHLIAEGEAVVIEEQFGVRITRLASNRQRARALT